VSVAVVVSPSYTRKLCVAAVTRFEVVANYDFLGALGPEVVTFSLPV
jgi:hypothetical protein